MKTTSGILGAVLVLSLVFAGLSTASDTYATKSKSSENSRYSSDKRNESSHKDKDDDYKDKKDHDEKKRDHRKDDKREDKHDRKDNKKSEDRDDKHNERSKDDAKRDHKDDDRKDHNKPDRSEDDKKSHKFTICHATNSTKNPYVMITVDYHSFVKKGHDGHEGGVPTSTSDLKTMKENKQRWGDVIPAVQKHNYAGSNWTTSGKALLDNKCKLVSVKDANDEGNGSVTTPDDETPVVNVLDDAASTDVPALAGKGGTATELPQTGSDVSSLIILAAGMITAAATYGVMFLRKALF